MYWLNLDWIVVNWMPLAAALVLGFILGWLLTGLSPARRARELEARIAELESKHRKADRDLGDLRRESEPLKARLAAVQSDLESARARVPELEKSLALLEEEKAALLEEKERGAALAAAEASVAEAAAAIASDAGAESGAEGDAEAGAAATRTLAAGIEQETAIEPASVMALAPDQIAAGFASIARKPEVAVPSEKDVALNEAYRRISDLERRLQESSGTLTARIAELESTRAELLASSAARHELETRLVRAREDVASELAVLASTMIKMKDDALARADARVAALSAELESVRSNEARSTSMSTAD